MRRVQFRVRARLRRPGKPDQPLHGHARSLEQSDQPSPTQRLLPSRCAMCGASVIDHLDSAAHLAAAKFRGSRDRANSLLRL